MLDIRDLTVRYASRRASAPVKAVRHAALSIAPGEALSIIGASGAGKSALAGALVGLLPQAEVAGRALWKGADGAVCDLLALPQRRLRAMRGREIAMIFQDPATALDPVIRVGAQVAEPMRIHLRLGAAEARLRATALLARVGLPDPESVYNAYPHQLSGGMRQRVTIAAALASGPRLLIADEPTTALDAPLRAGILDLLDGLRRETGMALLTVTHDMDAVRRIGGRVLVMEAGQIVEDGPVEQILRTPQHGATRALIDAAKPLPPPATWPEGAPLLEIAGLTVSYGSERPAVRDVTIQLARGEALALVGASGSGKSTLARAALGLEPAEHGTVCIDGTNIARLRGAALRQIRTRIQMVFQDPVTSLDPRRRLGRQVADPLRNYGRMADNASIARAFTQVGLAPELMERLPHEVSGGQRQRVAIARALALDPDILVVDEGLSALDSVQAAAILTLLRAEQARRGLAILFVTHDLKAARAIAHRIAVMEEGRVVEEGPAARLLSAPAHPHTRALVAASELGNPAPAQ
ncbi:nickel ABC transporter ATP-binding protein NikE [Roseovarius sp. S4756]|uniref:nickel ABC transporter ATP-binding protein NikE n=1 Tax=Roseovarius maritimus TaxID=3342637 RepID=UPI00372B1734